MSALHGSCLLPSPVCICKGVEDGLCSAQQAGTLNVSKNPRMNGVWCHGRTRLVHLATSKVADLADSFRRQTLLVLLRLTSLPIVQNGLP
jgi:hypothetical protein